MGSPVRERVALHKPLSTHSPFALNREFINSSEIIFQKISAPANAMSTGGINVWIIDEIFNGKKCVSRCNLRLAANRRALELHLWDSRNEIDVLRFYLFPSSCQTPMKFRESSRSFHLSFVANAEKYHLILFILLSARDRKRAL